MAGRRSTRRCTKRRLTRLQLTGRQRTVDAISQPEEVSVPLIRFSCPSCKKTYQAPADAGGKSTTCKACGQKLKIPSPPAPSEIPTAAAADEAVPKSQIPWDRWLRECQQRFGKPPRSFDDETKTYLSMKLAWVYGLLFFSPICKLLKSSRQKSIFGRGKVVWAHVIQANTMLWEPHEPTPEDDGDAPGELVFSLDTTGRVTPESLKPIAEELAGTRGQTMGDPDLQRIADYLEAETVRVFGWDVPKPISPNTACYISTTMFIRPHLPGAKLSREFLPVVVSHKAPYYVMPLPERFWSPQLLEWWMAG